MEVVSKDGGQSSVEAAGQATHPVHEERTLTSTEREKIDEGTKDVSELISLLFMVLKSHKRQKRH